MPQHQLLSNTNQKKFAFIDQFAMNKELLYPFAIDDTLLIDLNKGNIDYSAVLHFWPTEPAVFLGMVDTKLPDFQAGVKFLKASHYTPIIRPAGGLAVVSDLGIINFTLVIKPEEHLNIDDGYELMVDLLNRMVAPYGFTAKAGEVDTSYCPGKYDISINGKKIAGLAQRRIGQSVGIYVYLSLTGPQQKRGQLIRQFYSVSQAEQDEKQRYPIVDADSMTNIDNFIPEFSNETFFKESLIEVISGESISFAVNLAELDFETALVKMQKRNKDVHTLLTEDHQ